MEEEIRKELEAAEQAGEKLTDEEMDDVAGGDRILDPFNGTRYARCPYCGCRDIERTRKVYGTQWARCLNDTCNQEFILGCTSGKYSQIDAN